VKQMKAMAKIDSDVHAALKRNADAFNQLSFDVIWEENVRLRQALAAALNYLRPLAQRAEKNHRDCEAILVKEIDKLLEEVAQDE